MDINFGYPPLRGCLGRGGAAYGLRGRPDSGVGDGTDLIHSLGMSQVCPYLAPQL